MTETAPRRCDFNTSELEVSLDLTFPGTIAAIEPVVQRIMGTIGQMACAIGKEHAIEVAVYEALANAVRHGCHEDPSCEVQVSVACDPERGLLIVVRDPGPGFDPASLPSPVTAENLMRSHGRGVFLINQLMDEVRFERNGTEIWMHKR